MVHRPRPGGRRSKQRPGTATATAVEPPTKDREETRRRPTTMRHQIQRGREHHYASEDVTAADPLKGVTGLQLRAAMAANFSRYMRIAHREEQPQPGWERGLVEWDDDEVDALRAKGVV